MQNFHQEVLEYNEQFVDFTSYEDSINAVYLIRTAGA